jgi:peptidoglycan/LPS O-acetylase OafA/YrhL
MPTTLPQPTPRIAWLEGLRGLASVQVLLLHLAGAFCLPLIEGAARSPLYLLYDGETAVHLFFLLSGAVLTRGFAKHWRTPLATLAARALRLGLPAAAATLLACLAYHAFGTAHGPAGALLGSWWLQQNWLADGSLGSLLAQAFPVALLTGFADSTSLSFLAPWLPAGPAAYNAPLWTLSLELQGSVLVLALVGLRAAAPRLWPFALAALAGLSLRSPLLGFVLGHAAMVLLPRCAPAWARLPVAARLTLGLTALAAGAALALPATPFASFDTLAKTPLPLLPALSPEAIQRSLAALLELAGLLALPAPQRWLAGPTMQALGRLSFPLYLVHWPLLMGPGAAFALALAPWFGTSTAALAGATLAAGLTLALAVLALPLDAAAVSLARRARLALTAPAPLPNAQHQTP